MEYIIFGYHYKVRWMEMSNLILSICIPTYGRVEILHNTLDSIFSQNFNSGLFEVCISDNSPTDETKVMIDKFFFNRENIYYKKSTCEGFLNSIEALKMGKGRFLKLHNNYTMFKEGSLQKIIDFVSAYDDEKTTLFFTFSSVKQDLDCVSYDSFDLFMKSISYFSTWSTSFGIMNKDFQNICSKDFKFDKMFPHTSLLFAMNSNKKFVVNNKNYFDNQDVGQKGGYNLPQTFGTRYIGMCKDLLLENKISEKTYDSIKLGILTFIADWYLNVKFFAKKYTFSFDNWESIVFDLYGKEGISFVKKNYRKKMIKYIIKRLLNKY